MSPLIEAISVATPVCADKVSDQVGPLPVVCSVCFLGVLETFAVVWVSMSQGVVWANQVLGEGESGTAGACMLSKYSSHQESKSVWSMTSISLEYTGAGILACSTFNTQTTGDLYKVCNHNGTYVAIVRVRKLKRR